ncbi:MAG TPA: AsmA family protein [bacterium]|jgi:hypothetical protein|nr:AsmA family protein [bacterium]
MKPKIDAPKPTRRIPRWLLVLGSLALLLGLTTMVAPFFIPWGKLKDEAVAAGSKALGRQLGIDQIEVSLFSGVHIKNLRLANANGGFSDQALFTNDDAKVDVSLLSLFTGKLVINSVTFIKPQVLIETNAKGISNLQGLGSPPAPASPGKSAPSAGVATATVGGQTFPAVLLALVIQDGDVVVRDRQKGTETAIHGLNVKLQGLSLAAAGASRLESDMVAEVQGKKIPLSLICDFKLDMAHERVDIRSMELKAPALDATATGTVKGFDAPALDLKIEGGLDLSQLDGLLPPSVLAGLPAGLRIGGALKLHMGVQGPAASPKDLALKGSLDFDKVTAAAGSNAPPGSLGGTLRFELSKQLLSTATDLELCGGRLKGPSSVDLGQSLPVYSSALELSGVDMRALVDQVAAADPDLALAQAKGKVDGTLDVKASVQGRGFAEPALMDNARAGVEFSFADGVIHRTNMMERLATAVPYPKIQDFLRSDVKFGRAEGSAQYSSRRLTLKSFSLGSGNDWRQGTVFVQATGFMVPGGRLNFRIVPHFNPSMDLIGGDIGKALADSKGWTTFDYIDYGGPSSAAAKADFSPALNKATRRVLMQHLGQIPQGAQKAIESGAGTLFKQIPGLNKLFGQ